MSRLKLTVLSLLLLMTQLALASFTGEYEGDFEGEKVRLVLKQDGKSLSGSGNMGEAKFQFSGTAQGDTASGTARSDDGTAYFRAKLSGDDLKLTVCEDADFADVETIDFKRVKSEPASEGPKKDGKFFKGKMGTLKDGTEYTHSSGGKFKYPKGWSIKEAEGYVQLNPANAETGEIYLVAAESAGDAKDPGAPEILEYLDGQIQGFFPDAKRSGKPEAANSGAGKGVALKWNATTEGKPVVIRAYVTILKGYGISVIGIGTAAQIEKRDPILREIFMTLGWGQGKISKELVGTWKYWGYKGSSDGKYGREESATAELRADGTFSYTNSSETGITADTGSLNSRRGNGWSGTWTASGDTLTLNFEDGSSESFSFRFKTESSGNTFLVTKPAGGGKEMEWSRAG